MKNIFITTILASMALATPALAVTNTEAVPSSGLYVGGFGGYDWSDLDTSVAGFNPKPDGWEGGVFAGYRVDSLVNSMGMSGAIEGFYGWSSADDTIAGVNIQKDHEWGVSFRPGFVAISKATAPLGINPYAILGYRNTEFQGSVAGSSGSEHYDGFELGIGTELITFGHFGVRAEYAHVWYGSQGGVDPSSDDVRVGLAYHF